MNNKQVTLDIFHKEGEKIEIGDVVSTTTSEFDYNGITHCFDREATKFTTVEAVKVGYNYDNYVAEKSCNGGCYGFDYYEVKKIVGATKITVEDDFGKHEFTTNSDCITIRDDGNGNISFAEGEINGELCEECCDCLETGKCIKEKTYIAIYDDYDDEWDLHSLGDNGNPSSERIIQGKESLYELIEEAKRWSIPREAILGKANASEISQWGK